MKKKYQNRKIELAKTLLRNPARDVLVVNDYLIRQRYFAEANDIINQIEILENKIQLFYSNDQKQFDAWYTLTFREDLLLVERAQIRFQKLVEFHNWVVAAARMQAVELSEALILMQEEERRYQNGSEEERCKIELGRRMRNTFIEADTGEKCDEEAAFDHKDSNHEGLALEVLFERLEGILLSDDHEILSLQEQRLGRIAALDSETMELALKDQETSFLLFHLGLSWGEKKYDYTFFLQVWRLLSEAQKIYFSDVYESIKNQSIKFLLRRIGSKADLNFDSDKNEELESDIKSDEGEETHHFKDEFFEQKGFSKKAKSNFDPLEEERLKQLYRNLVRKLHPDVQESEKPQSWMKRFWYSVQDAYKSKDISALDRLFKLTLLRTNSLNQLTFDEIGQAKGWLKKDLSLLQNEQSQLKKSLAWGFNERKDFSALTRKIRKEVEETRDAVLFQIQKIKMQHQMLESMGLNEDFNNQNIHKKKTQKNKKQSRRKPKRKQNRFK